MWVGQLMRGMLGEPQPDQAKALELRVGQIVRGVVLQLLDGKDALVSLAGVQVRARLETPLLPGQSSLLQVMPESTAGTIVLRQADALSAQPSEESLRELMKQLGLPDKRWAVELALDLRRGGYPVTRETGAALRQAAAFRPADVPEAEWMQAAATAWKRGLPVTEGTVAALRQAMFGKPAGELLESLRGQLAALAGRQGSAEGGQFPSAAARVLALLAEGEALLAGPAGRMGGQAQAASAGGSAGLTGAAPGAAGAQSGGAGTAAAIAQSGQAQPGPSSAGMAPAGSALQAGGGAAGLAAGAGQSPAAAGASAPAAGGSAQPSAAQAANVQQQGVAASGAPSGAAAQAQQAAPAQGGDWIHGLLKWLGVDYEKQLAQMAGSRSGPAGGQQEAATRPAGAGHAPAAPDAGTSAAGRDAAAPGAAPGATLPGVADRMAPAGRGAIPFPPLAAEAQPAQTGGSGFAAGETLKQALLSLAASEDVPAALRDTAQQLVQQITGQQLLLAPERNGALFSHMTLFIPFQGEDGGTTAQITIQSRRGRKGELDPDNCRLLFDLRMKHLGDTVVDVQVVDRFVSLNLWNDHPAMNRLVALSRDEAAEALGRVGYQLSSMHVKPFPDTAARNAEKEPAAPAPPDPSVYAGKPYKGVDYRA